jgi:Fe-S-cluster-containing dehydrogenase component
MKKAHMIIDIARCQDCNNCFISCKDEHWENDHMPIAKAQPRHGHRWIDIDRLERGQYPLQDVAYLPHLCMHCEDAPCMKGITDGTIYKRPDGIVIIDPVKAKGEKALAASCPYGAIYWNEESQLAQKCTMCAHLLDAGWKQPRCSNSCPTGALTFVQAEDSEMAKMVKDQGLESYYPDKEPRPKVYYKNLYRFTKCHVAGSVAIAHEDECAEGATITLTSAKTKAVSKGTTNNYGDFKLDGLDPNSGRYVLEVEFKGSKKRVEVDLKASINVGTIYVEKSSTPVRA